MDYGPVGVSEGMTTDLRELAVYPPSIGEGGYYGVTNVCGINIPSRSFGTHGVELPQDMLPINDWRFDFNTFSPVAALAFKTNFSATTASLLPPAGIGEANWSGMLPANHGVDSAQAMLPLIGTTRPASETSRSGEDPEVATQIYSSGNPKEMVTNLLTPGDMKSRSIHGQRYQQRPRKFVQEKSLEEIDQLIKQATTKEERKELNDQKRRTSNKMAARRSRKRKDDLLKGFEQKERIWLKREADLVGKILQLENENTAMKSFYEVTKRENAALCKASL